MKNKSGFVTMTLVYTFLILFLFLLLSILTVFGQKNKMLDAINGRVIEETRLNTVYDEVYSIPYTSGGKVVTFKVPYTGYYKIELWGAQGGNATYNSTTYTGGYGAYTRAYINLKKDRVIYVIVGGSGTSIASSAYGANTIVQGGYNGGGTTLGTGSSTSYAASGGGATHISTSNKLLPNASKNAETIYLVAAGGSGAVAGPAGYYYNGGHGGGITGHSSYNSSLIPNQTSGNAFGKGGQTINSGGSVNANLGAGGGGYYGGYALSGGSSYANPVVVAEGSSKMCCYSGCGCGTGVVYSSAVSEYPKSGNGQAIITFYGTSYSGG